MLRAVHPILGSEDLARSIEFYTKKLGFTLAFFDSPDEPNYIGFRRDDVELHMQFQFGNEMSSTRLRLLVSNPDALLAEFLERGVKITEHGIRDTDWGTREFALWDPDRNALTFYADL